ncbi:RDD family protein [Nocardia sp. NPDC051929]|uniref:RDD family protein n=1 Tax=Nocardia sp. NPDC051929 TaxID=3364327 RepID=UPI0037C84344
MADGQGAGDLVPAGRRAAAWGVDFGLVLGLAVLLGAVTHYRIADYLSGWADLAGTGVWDVIQSNGNWGGAGKTFGMEVVHTVLVFIIEAFGALIAATFAYQFAGLAWQGRTLGKALLDLRVGSVRGGEDRLGRGQAARRAFVGTMTDVGLYSCACIALLAGRFLLSFVLWLIAIVVLVINAVCVFGSSRRSLVDRVAGTVVVQAGLLRKSLETARDHVVVQRGIQGAQEGIEHIQTATRQIAQLATPEQMRQLRDSERAAQLRELGQDVGRRTAESARRAVRSERGQQAQRVAKRAGAGLRGAYERRRGTGNREG